MRTHLFCAMLLLASAPAYATNAVLVGQLDVSPQEQYTDVWGWQDPQTLRLYALVGNNASGLHIVDVTDPSLPFAVSTVNTVPRFDMKTRGSLVYTVDGFTGTGGVVDISNPASPVVVGSFPGGHNIFIDDAGFLYVCQPGLSIYDLNIDPHTPPLAFNNGATDGHDAMVVGDLLYEFRGPTATVLWDVTDRYNPVPFTAIVDPTMTYHHNGWPTDDGRYLFITDEYALNPSPDITVWDLVDPLHPVRIGEISDPSSSVHNCYVIGDLLYVAYYTAGFRLYDIADPAQPVLLDTHDTSSSTGEGVFQGAWGCYPFSPDGSIYINDRPNGLFVFRLENVPTGVPRTPARAPRLVVQAAAPNPFAGTTTLRYSLADDGRVTAAVYDAAGRRVRQLAGGDITAGEHTLTWDGRDDSGVRMASGIYFCRVAGGGETRVGKMVLLR
ncbi:MAG TPA: choice-of-anchor B family protein, partial [Candidatus Krumholzibacteria bacterium]|nr:choice-of-anchor B family protein [Candidatus Krumholzibacteria bacterium]